MAARPQSLHDYLHDQLGWFEIDPQVRAVADRIIYNLDANGYLQSSLEDLFGVHASEEEMALARQALALVQRLDPLGVGAGTCGSARPAAHSRHARLRRAATLISVHLEDIEHNRLPVIARRTGYSIPTIQEAIKQLRLLNPSRGPNSATPMFPPSRPTFSWSKTTRAATASAWRTAARRTSSSACITANSCKAACRRRHPGLYQAEVQLGPVADRLHRTAPQHAHQGRPGDHRSSEGFPRQGPGAHRALEDATDRRQGWGPRHHGQPRG